MDAYQRRLARRLVSTGEDLGVLAVVVPPAWGLDAVLEPARDAYAVRTLATWTPGARAFTLIDARDASVADVRSVIERRSGEAVVFATNDPMAVWLDDLTVLGPEACGMSIDDVTIDLTATERDVVDDAIERSGGQPLFVKAAIDAVIAARGTATPPLVPEADRHIRSEMERTWQALGNDERLVLTIASSVPDIALADLHAAGLADIDAIWRRCQLAGFTCSGGVSPATTALARDVLGAWMRLGPDTVPHALRRSLVSTLRHAGRHHVLVHVLALIGVSAKTPALLRELWLGTGFRLVQHTSARETLIGLLGACMLVPGADDLGWMHAARGTMRLLSGSFTGAADDLERALELGDDSGDVRLRLGLAYLYLDDTEAMGRVADELAASATSDDLRASGTAMRAIAHVRRGAVDAAMAEAERAESLLGGRRSLTVRADTHYARSLIAHSDGDRGLLDYHLHAALTLARQDGNVAFEFWLMSRLAASAVEEARYADAAIACDELIEAAERRCTPGLSVTALLLAAESERLQGKLHAAISRLERAREMAVDAGPRFARVWMLEMGWCRLMRGEWELARRELRQSLQLARVAGAIAEPGARVGLGLADLFAGKFEDALANATAAMDGADDHWRARAAAIAAAAANYAGHADALEIATHGLDHALASWDPHGELMCRGIIALLKDPVDVDALVTVAERCFELGHVLEAAMWNLFVAREIGGAEGERLGESSLRIMREHEAPSLVAALDSMLAGAGRSTPPPVPEPDGVVHIEILGGFRATRSGLEVPAGDFGSRKARQLLALLATRFPERLSRDAIVEVLWGDGGSQRRLRSLISEVRRALDPNKRAAPGTYVGADELSVWLEPARVSVDAMQLLDGAEQARRAEHRGDRRAARAHAMAAAALFAGGVTVDVDALSVELVRENVRVTYGELCRSLGRWALEALDFEDSIAWWMRVLAVDEYDTVAHEGLVDALVQQGRPREARRAYARYCELMRDLGVEPEPMPVSRIT